jgi:hypothetical protein
MPYGIVFMSNVLPTLILTGGGLAAIWIVTHGWLKYKSRPTPEELSRIAESMELLGQSVEDMRDELRDQMIEVRGLSGRVEFAERLLTQAREEERL